MEKPDSILPPALQFSPNRLLDSREGDLALVLLRGPGGIFLGGGRFLDGLLHAVQTDVCQSRCQPATISNFTTTRWRD